MKNAVSGSLAQALANGFTACPNCWGSKKTTPEPTLAPDATPTADPENGNNGYSGVYVYATETGSRYHASKDCTDLESGSVKVLLEQAIDGMEAEIPEVMFTKRADEMINDYAYRLQAQGIDLQTYLQYMGQDMDAFRATFKDGAEKQVKASLVLEAIVAAEKLEATEDEISAEIDKLAQQYGMEAEQIKKAVPADQIAADVTTKKALDLIVDSAKLVEKKAEKKAAKKSTAKKSTAKKADDEKAEKKPAAKKTAAKKPAAKKTAKKEEDAE